MNTIYFPESDYSPVVLDDDTPLSLGLTLENSPILFGCRTGICGTCLVSARGEMTEPSAAEKEVLSLLAPACPTARLACQIQLSGAVELMPIAG